jgi:hypothetical protein
LFLLMVVEKGPVCLSVCVSGCQRGEQGNPDVVGRRNGVQTNVWERKEEKKMNGQQAQTTFFFLCYTFKAVRGMACVCTWPLPFSPFE